MTTVAPLRALTVIQPWATLIALGIKPIENRTWAPPASLVGGWLAIHAGKRLDRTHWEDAADAALRAGLRVPLLDAYDDADDEREYATTAVPYGAIVAVVRVAGYVTASDDAWFCGPIGWQLTDVVAIDPVACSGAQGLWTVAGDALARTREGYRAARQQDTGARGAGGEE